MPRRNANQGKKLIRITVLDRVVREGLFKEVTVRRLNEVQLPRYGALRKKSILSKR